MNRLDRLLLTANKDFETWMLICFNSLIHLNDKINIYRKKKKMQFFLYWDSALYVFFDIQKTNLSNFITYFRFKLPKNNKTIIVMHKIT